MGYQIIMAELQHLRVGHTGNWSLQVLPIEMARVKICGIRSISDMRMAVRCGADAIGVLAGQLHSSPDFVPASLADEICAAAPPFVTTVLVTHIADPDAVLMLASSIRSTAVQLHSDLELRVLDELRRALSPRKIVVKVTVEDSRAIERARELDHHADAILLDSIDRATGQIGGTGITHDWAISSQIVLQVSTPVILAGGLSPANIRQAIHQVQPWAVDVNSGVRNNAGFKDGNLIRAFVEGSRMLD